MKSKINKNKNNPKKRSKLLIALFLLSAATTASLILTVSLTQIARKNEYSKINSEYLKSLQQYKLKRENISSTWQKQFDKLEKENNKKDFIVLWKNFQNTENTQQNNKTKPQTTESTTQTETNENEFSLDKWPVTIASVKDLEYIDQRPYINKYDNNFDYVLYAPKEQETPEKNRHLIKISKEYIDFYNNKFLISEKTQNLGYFSCEHLFDIIRKNLEVNKNPSPRDILLYLNPDKANIYSFTKEDKQILLTDKIHFVINDVLRYNFVQYTPIDFSNLKEKDGFYYFIIETFKNEEIKDQHYENKILNVDDIEAHYVHKLENKNKHNLAYKELKTENWTSDSKYLDLMLSIDELEKYRNVKLKELWNMFQELISNDEKLKKEFSDIDIDYISFFNKNIQFSRVIETNKNVEDLSSMRELFSPFSYAHKQKVLIRIQFKNNKIKHKDKASWKYVIKDEDDKKLYVSEINDNFVKVLYRVKPAVNSYTYFTSLKSEIKEELANNFSQYDSVLFNKLPENKVLVWDTWKLDAKTIMNSVSNSNLDSEGFINLEVKFVVKDIEEYDKYFTKLNVDINGYEKRSIKYIPYLTKIEEKLAKMYNDAKKQYGKYLTYALITHDLEWLDRFKNTILIESPNIFENETELNENVDMQVNNNYAFIRLILDAVKLKELSNPKLSIDDSTKALNLLHSKDNNAINTEYTDVVHEISRQFNNSLSQSNKYLELRHNDIEKLEDFKTVKLPEILKKYDLTKEETKKSAINEATQILEELLKDSIKKHTEANPLPSGHN